MQITLDMPLVSDCSVAECAYNVNKGCHARAITVGDGVHPGCDTYLGSANHTRSGPNAAGVGACKVSACQYNEDYECTAESIQVGFHGDKINCLTFTANT